MTTQRPDASIRYRGNPPLTDFDPFDLMAQIDQIRHDWQTLDVQYEDAREQWSKAKKQADARRDHIAREVAKDKTYTNADSRKQRTEELLWQRFAPDMEQLGDIEEYKDAISESRDRAEKDLKVYVAFLDFLTAREYKQGTQLKYDGLVALQEALGRTKSAIPLSQDLDDDSGLSEGPSVNAAYIDPHPPIDPGLLAKKAAIVSAREVAMARGESVWISGQVRKPAAPMAVQADEAWLDDPF